MLCLWELASKGGVEKRIMRASRKKKGVIVLWSRIDIGRVGISIIPAIHDLWNHTDPGQKLGLENFVMRIAMRIADSNREVAPPI